MVLSAVVRHRVQIHYLLRLFLFWLLVFTLFRVVFMAFHSGASGRVDWTSGCLSFPAGFPLDLSMIAYLMIPSFLLWGLRQWWPARGITLINTGYHIILLFLISILSIANLKMYGEWQALLNYSVFNYLAYPKEVLSFISSAELFGWMALLILYFLCLLWLYKRMVTRFDVVHKRVWIRLALILLTPGALVVAARGGFQLIPINESSAYFSGVSFYNHVAVNPLWYFVHSYLERDSEENPYRFIPPEEAVLHNQNLFRTNDLPSTSILTTDRPNIVIILLESWTADIIEALGGEMCVTPQFDSLRKTGVLFTRVYSAGSRTEHSLASVLSGYPSAPRKSIINIPYKAEKLNNINTILRDEGYHSSFYYGGDIGFANMKSFLLNAHFNTLIDKSGFEETQLNSKWGAHDEYVFQKQLQDLRQTPEPFLSVLLTLSSHEPFEVPTETLWYTGREEPDLFRNAVHYTDQCLGDYFKEARKQDWYSNTLYILMADHGQRLPYFTDLNLPRSQHIPFLWVGEVIRDSCRGATVDKVANQNDLAATLMGQLSKSMSDFPRSKDLLHPNVREFAYYTNDNVMGWVTPHQSFIYFYTTGDLKFTSPIKSDEPLQDSLVRDAKAFLQTHYQEFLMF